MRTILAVIMAAAVLAQETDPAATAAPLFDIPRLDNVAIDGQPGDWGDGGFRVDVLPVESGEIWPAENLNAALRLGWNDRGLLVLLTVNDDVSVEDPNLERLWQKDSKELGIATAASETYRTELSESLWNNWMDSSERDNQSAALLAAMFDASAVTGTNGVHCSARESDRQWWVSMKRTLAGMPERKFVCPLPLVGEEARVLREGTPQDAGMKPDAAEKIDAVCREWGMRHVQSQQKHELFSVASGSGNLCSARDCPMVGRVSNYLKGRSP